MTVIVVYENISELISGNAVLSHIDVEGSTPPWGARSKAYTIVIIHIYEIHTQKNIKIT